MKRELRRRAPGNRAVLLVAAAVALVTMITLSGCGMISGLRDLKAMEVRMPGDLAAIADGAYTGEWDAQIVRASVLVSVSGGRISAVEIVEHECGRGEPAEAIVAAIVAEQGLQIDSVSGATASSKAILKSVEVALEGAPRNTP